jgi:NADH-quinone oxidoreductase subunit G/NADP-reducing hydrogenase subunit HndD
MATIEVNGKPVEAKPGEMLLDALRRAGINVPTLCHMENLFPSGACRMCVVEVEGARTLLPSCACPVTDGMKVKTHSQRALMARKTIIELLLANHPDDCLYCVRSGHCDLQRLANELGVHNRRYTGFKNEYFEDQSSPSLVRDPAKCILCGRCVRVCEEIQGVSAIDFAGRGSKARVETTFNEGLNVSNCINCGQCIMVCPTGALREQSHIKAVMDAIAKPDMIVVAQHAPAVSVTLGEEFWPKAWRQDVDGVMVAALRKMGFDRVFETSFTADLTIMEEASELAHRVKTGGVLPMLTSCSPGWIKFVETEYPEFIPNLSSCKSPQQMMGALIKSYYAEKMGVDPSKIFSVSIMPCTAKKFEMGRPEMLNHGIADIDAVLTTRELARMIRTHGIDMQSLQPDTADTPFGERTTAGKLFGATGGVMEAAVRTAHFLLTGNELEDLKVQAVRGLDGVKEARVKIGELEVGVAVASGLANARKLLEDVKAGRRDLHFIEIMTCPGGCIAGGGQPYDTDLEAVRGRMQTLYTIDRNETVRVSHKNETIKRLYEEYLGEPLGEKSHHLLHTHYQKRTITV